ncbi:MAG: hypothetical protein H7061_01790 [Bdellovibrionaceae bacterium]|nr:hypothetical protein [Bdellovibrio sp.]
MRKLNLKILVLTFFAVNLLSKNAKAEYRTFTLLLTNTKTKSAKHIQTTLDPNQYKTIYPLAPDEKLTYVQTWRCKGRTDFFKARCDQPTKAQN